MVTVTYTWRKHARPNSCVKCNSLAGYSWTFENETPTVLIHPQFGIVWDLIIDQSRAHGLQPYNCRCWLTIDINDSDLMEDLDVIDKGLTSLDSNLDSSLNYVTAFLSVLEGLT